MKRSVLTGLIGTVMVCLAGICHAEDSAKETLQRFALVAGSNNGGPNRVQLKYAHTDAKSMARVLRQLGGVDYRDSLLILEPDRFDFEAAIARMHNILINNRKSGVRSELLFYFSGHSDEQGLLLGDDLFTYRELRDALSDLPADVRIGILDSCASGAMTRGKGGTRRQPFLIDTSVAVEGYAYLTSASADEAAQESDRVGGSFFTHFLISGLRGAADHNRDRKVTLNEAYQYAFNETLARTESTQAGPQHPGYDFQLKGSGDLVLTDLRGTSAMMQVSSEVQGKVFIRNRNGDLIAEINKTAGRPIELGIDPGRYEVTLENGGRILKGSVDIERGRIARLNEQTLTLGIRENTVSRGLAPEPSPTEPAPPEAPAADFPEVATGEPSMPAPSPDPVPELSPAPSPQAPVDRGYITLKNGERLVHRPFRVALLPGLTIPHWRTLPGKQLNRFSFNFVGYGHYLSGTEFSVLAAVRRYDVHGFQWAGIFNHTNGAQSGFQWAGIYNMVLGDFHGTQAGGIFNVVAGESVGFRGAGIFNFTGSAAKGFMGAGISNIVHGPNWGFQGAGIMNVNTRSSKGFQGAGIINTNGGSAQGFQGAGIINTNGGSAQGFQGAGIINVNGDGMSGFQGAGIANISARGDSVGFQGAGITNYASAFRGGQFSGITNVSTDTLKGVQFSLINIGREVRGAQVGLVNIASRKLDGASIGLINYAGNGILAPSLWASDTSLANLAFKMGSRHIYGLFGAGVHPIPGQERYSLIYGIGGHLDLDLLWLDLDFSVHKLVNRYSWRGSASDFINKVRLTLGFRVIDELSIFAGPTLNLLAAESIRKAELIPGFASWEPDGDLHLRLSMGFVLGLQWEPHWGDLNSRDPEPPEL